ncbi:MAG TPA: glycosyltransferase family 2 protein [Candidatus Acidoferrales bacterium]|nr:glycosyltransferase family 2 protein [Candidatus Acidoferrales bacterium]
MNEFKPYLSVLIPAMNEGRTIDKVVDAVLRVDLPLEIVLVDDGSTDDTWAQMQARADGARVRAYRHTVNMGKGAAIRTALRHARGDLVIIQDADLEYDPKDFVRLVEPIRSGRASIVYGTRTFSSHTAYSFWYVMGNRLVTLAANVMYNTYLSDLETGYKLMPREVALGLDLEARGFELEPEITAKVLRMGHRIYEVPVEYAARSRAEGKKLKPSDGLKALVALARYRTWRPPQTRGFMHGIGRAEESHRRDGRPEEAERMEEQLPVTGRVDTGLR